MNPPPKVKICGITRPEDAETALRLGADFIGINLFSRSPRAVHAEEVPAIFEAVPAGKRVLVDVNPGTDVLEQHLRLGFDAFQLHCPHDLGLATLAGWAGLVGVEQLWLAPKVPPGEAFPQTALEFTNTILFDTYSQDPLVFGGTGKAADWGKFEEWRTLYAHKRWILAGGLGPENVRSALEQTSPDMVDFNSGVESAPGIKEPAKLKALFQILLA